MYRRSRKSCNVNVIHRITSETIRLSEMELKPGNKTKNSEISIIQQSRKNPSGSFQITSVCLTGRFDAGEDSADDLDESRTEDLSRIDNETPSFSEDTFSRDGDDCVNHCSTMSSPNKNVPFTSPTTTVTTSRATVPPSHVTSPASTSIGRKVGGRFKVVKIESVTPFVRGRWKCLDYVDHSKHTPPDGWVYCDDQYVKLSDVKATYTQAASKATTTTAQVKPEPLVCTFIRPNIPSQATDQQVGEPGTSYQRQFSAPETGYSVYPTQQFLYGTPPQFYSIQPQTPTALMQWPQYLPFQHQQQWMPQQLFMQHQLSLNEHAFKQMQQTAQSPQQQTFQQQQNIFEHAVYNPVTQQNIATQTVTSSDMDSLMQKFTFNENVLIARQQAMVSSQMMESDMDLPMPEQKYTISKSEENLQQGGYIQMQQQQGAASPQMMGFNIDVPMQEQKYTIPKKEENLQQGAYIQIPQQQTVTSPQMMDTSIDSPILQQQYLQQVQDIIKQVPQPHTVTSSQANVQPQQYVTRKDVYQSQNTQGPIEQQFVVTIKEKQGKNQQEQQQPSSVVSQPFTAIVVKQEPQQCTTEEQEQVLHAKIQIKEDFMLMSTSKSEFEEKVHKRKTSSTGNEVTLTSAVAFCRFIQYMGIVF